MPYQQDAKAVGVAAGTIIGNQATAKYKDQNNNPYNSTSNLVTTTVASIYSLTVTPDGTAAAPGQQQNATPGTIVYYPYTLTNNGNGPDTFTINSVYDATSTFGSGSIKRDVYYDANGNGIVDTNDTLIVTNAAGNNTTTGTTVSVPADGSIKLIVTYQVPNTGVTGGQLANVNLVATSVGDNTKTDINNFNRTTIVNDAVIAVTKSVDKASVNPSIASPLTNNELTYTLDVSNTGNKDATAVTVVDAIPANTVFKVGSVSVPSGVTVAYSNATTGTTYTYTPTGTYDSNVKRVRYTFTGSFAASVSRALTFTVRVNENAPSVTIPNNAEFQYIENGGTQRGDTTTDTYELTTNTVVTQVNKKAAALISFSSAPFSGTTTSGTEDPIFPAPTSDRTTIATTAAGTYIYYKNVVTNNGNATDAFNITLDSAASRLPSGAIVNFFIMTDSTTGSNNTSPLLDTNGDSIPDTASIAGVAPTAGSTTAGTATSYSIVTRVFIPANATNSNVTATAASSSGTSSVTVSTADAALVIAGDSLLIGGNVYKVSAVNTVTGVITLSSALTTNVAIGNTFTRSVSAIVKATSTNGGTAISATAGQNLTDTTANLLSSIVAPSVDISNIFNASTVDETSRTLTQSAQGATVSYPLNVRNTGSSSDTFSLSALQGGTVPAGTTVLFYQLIPASTTTVNDASIAATDNTIDLANATGYSAGDNLIINGKTFTVASVSGNTVTFAAGQTIGTIDNGTTISTAIATGMAAVERGTSAITSTNILPATTGAEQVVAVVSAPSTTPVLGAALTFRSTSTNNGSVTDSIVDNLNIPNFRTFTLQADRTGSVPPGGVLFYDHTITNTGNTAETYKLTLPTAAVNGLTYQLIDAAGNVVTTVNGANYEFTTPTPITANGTYTFKVKVTAPSNSAINTVSSINVTAQEVSTGSTGYVGDTKTNQDVTTVVEGFVSLTKSVATYTYGTTGLDGTLISATPTTVKPGEVLEYTIQYNNIGSQTAKEVAINDLIPANTTYVPGSLAIDPGTGTFASRTDATGDDTAQYTAATGTTFFLGTGATSSLGGDVVQNGNGRVRFRVRVNP